MYMYIRIYNISSPENNDSTKFAGHLAHGVLDLKARSPFLTLFVTPLPPQRTSGSQNCPLDEGYGLRWATLQITETITWALPNRPDQIYTMI